VPDERIVKALDFGSNPAAAGYDLVAEVSGTRLAWSLDSVHGYNLVDRRSGASPLDSVFGKDRENGLAKLEAVLEAGTPTRVGEAA